MASGPLSVKLTINRLDGDKGKITMKCTQESDIKAIRTRINMEWGLPLDEQMILFRGTKRVNGAEQPFNSPDLEDIVKEAGEEGLEMALIWMPKRLPEFMEKEGVEEINDKHRTGATLLHRAARKSEIGVLEELMVGTDLVAPPKELEVHDHRDKSGQTVLHVSCTCRFREQCLMVLECRRFTAVGLKDKDGQTALHLASHWGDAQVVKKIMEHKKFEEKQCTLRDKLGKTALEYAIECGHEECVEIIKQVATERGWTSVATASLGIDGAVGAVDEPDEEPDVDAPSEGEAPAEAPAAAVPKPAPAGKAAGGEAAAASNEARPEAPPPGNEPRPEPAAEEEEDARYRMDDLLKNGGPLVSSVRQVFEK